MVKGGERWVKGYGQPFTHRNTDKHWGFRGKGEGWREISRLLLCLAFTRQKLPCYSVEKTKNLHCLTILELYLNYTWCGLTTEIRRTYIKLTSEGIRIASHTKRSEVWQRNTPHHCHRNCHRRSDTWRKTNGSEKDGIQIALEQRSNQERLQSNKNNC